MYRLGFENIERLGEKKPPSPHPLKNRVLKESFTRPDGQNHREAGLVTGEKLACRGTLFGGTKNA
jgi:hypothetical protein